MNTTISPSQAATAEVTPTANGLGSDLEAFIRPHRQTLDGDAQAFEQARTDIEQSEATIHRFTQAVASANADALTLRDEIVELYRKGGTTKDAVKLKAKQRDALENAEIMASLVADGQIARAKAQLAASQAATDYVRHCNSASMALEEHLAQTVIDKLPDDLWLLIDLIANNAHRGLSALYNARDDLFDPDGFALDRFGLLLAAARPDKSPRLPAHTLIRVAPEGIAGHIQTPMERRGLERELAALQAKAYPLTSTTNEVTP